MSERENGLEEKLAALAKQRRAQLPDVYADILDPLVEHLRAIGIAEATLKVGDRLPFFQLPDARGRLVSSEEMLSRGPLAVGFFRGGWCPYCHVALEALSEVHADVLATGGAIVAITPDLIPATAETVASLKLSFDMLSDVDSAFGLQCGVIYRMPDDVIEFYRPLDIPRRHGSRSYFFPIPSAFVVDRSGTIRYAFADPDFTRKPEPETLIATLRLLAEEGSRQRSVELRDL